MSAERDPQLGLTFNFTNFYDLYRQEKVTKGIVLKAQEVSSLHQSRQQWIPQAAEVKVLSVDHTDEMKKWSHSEQNNAKKDLINNLRGLRDARKRLHFLMSEVDDLLKRS